MDKGTAKVLSGLLEEAIGNLGQALYVAMKGYQGQEYENFRSRSAEVVTDISAFLLDPIYKRFPELEPELHRDKANLWCHIEREE